MIAHLEQFTYAFHRVTAFSLMINLPFMTQLLLRLRVTQNTLQLPLFLFCIFFAFACNAKRFPIVFLLRLRVTQKALQLSFFFSSSPFYFSRQCFWMDQQKLFSVICPTAAFSACDQDWS